MSERSPRVGDQVFFVQSNSPEICPAVVCYVHPDGSTLNLCVFMPNGNPYPLKGVPEVQTAERGPSWHFA